LNETKEYGCHQFIELVDLYKKIVLLHPLSKKGSPEIKRWIISENEHYKKRYR